VFKVRTVRNIAVLCCLQLAVQDVAQLLGKCGLSQEEDRRGPVGWEYAVLWCWQLAVQGTRCRARGAGHAVQGTWCGARGAGHAVQGTVCMIGQVRAEPGRGRQAGTGGAG
jgi:hypothetical protein